MKGTKAEKLVYYIFVKPALPIFMLLGTSTIGMMIAYILTDDPTLHVAPMFTAYASIIYILIAVAVRGRRSNDDERDKASSGQ